MLSVAPHNNFLSIEIKTPEYILKWKNLYLDPNEFSDIGRIWKDV